MIFSKNASQYVRGLWRSGLAHPEVVEGLVLLVDEICEADGAVGDEGVGRDGGVVPHRQPHHLRLPQQVRRERLVPCRVLNE